MSAVCRFAKAQCLVFCEQIAVWEETEFIPESAFLDHIIAGTNLRLTLLRIDEFWTSVAIQSSYEV